MKRLREKKYLIYIVLYAFLLFCVLYKPNYIITKPGGIDNVKKSYTISSENKIAGSINITYISSVEPNLLYYWYAKLRHYEITKVSDYAPNGLKNEEKVDALLYLSSVNNAIYNAYKYAKKDIKIINEKVYVDYSINEDSELKDGDLLLEINGKKINSYDEISKILDESDDEYVDIKYQRDDKVKNTKVKLIKTPTRNYLGVKIIDVFDYETNPHIDFKIKDDVAGPSGGAMMTLSIYASLLDYDITHGLKIAGTGTIDREGNIGPIGGVDYKIKSALKSHVDVFFVPKYLNYAEVLDLNIDLKDMQVIPVETFEDIINYLNKK